MNEKGKENKIKNIHKIKFHTGLYTYYSILK